MRRSLQSGSSRSSRRRKHAEIAGLSSMHSTKLRDVMIIAEQEGLLHGERTQVVRGRMPEALVARAKKRTGIDSDTDLIEVALAHVAVADDYADWLLSRRGVIGPEADLEF
jgi:hypothetical protein